MGKNTKIKANELNNMILKILLVFDGADTIWWMVPVWPKKKFTFLVLFL